MGKIVIVKCFLVSQLIYIMQSIGLPEKVLIDVNRLFYKFIWQKRFSNRKAFEKVKRVIVEGNLEDGGLKWSMSFIYRKPFTFNGLEN